MHGVGCLWVEATYSGGNTNFSYDACRIPWRVGQDYLWNGTANDRLAHDAPDRNVKWFSDKIKGKPEDTLAAYNIDGTDRATYASPRNMVGPMAVAAMVDPSNQSSLDLMYDYLRTQEPTSDWPGGYFQDAVLVMSMLVLTGNMPNFYDHAPYPANTLPIEEPDDRTPPSRPTGLSVIDRTLNSIELSWNASTDAHQVSYEVYAADQLLNVTGVTATTLQYLDPGTVYPIRVTARDAAGNKTSSATLDVSTVADTRAPGKVSAITSEPKRRSIIIGWQQVADNDGNGSLSYDVLLDGKRVNVDPICVTSGYKLERLHPGATYRIRIVARDVSGNSSTSDEFTASTAGR